MVTRAVQGGLLRASPRARDNVGALLQAAALFVFGLSIPRVSTIVLDLAAVGTLLRVLHAGRIGRGFVRRLLLLAAALSTYYAVATSYGIVPLREALHYGFLAVVGYAAGYLVYHRDAWGSPRQAEGMLAGVLGAVLYSVLSVAGGTTASAPEWHRGADSFWEPGTLISATSLGALSGLGLCLAPVLLFGRALGRRKTLFTLAVLLAMAGGLYVNGALSNRTPVLACACALVLGMVLVARSRDLPLASKVIRIGSAAVAGVAVISLHFLWSTLSSSSIYGRFDAEGLTTARYSQWALVLTGLMEHPFGGRAIPLTENYAHNMWLDIAWDAGIIPLVLMLVFHLSHARAIRSALSSIQPLDTRLLLGGLGSGLLVIAMAEPVMLMSVTFQVLSFYFLGFTLAVGSTARVSASAPLRGSTDSQFGRA